MNVKERAHPTAATVEQAKAKTAAGQAAISIPNFSTSNAGRQLLRVSDFLRYGKENALHLGELKQLLHKDGRTIRLMIQHERQHVPIVSDNRSGYWIGTPDEANAFARSMRARAFEIQRAAAFVQLATLEEKNDS